jgi:two-component system LytT family sensor kinase
MRIGGETSSGWARFGLLAALWAIPGLAGTTQVYFLYEIQDIGMSAWRILAWQLALWEFWALATPAILAAGRRFPLDAQRWRRRMTAVPVHLAWNALLALAHQGLGYGLGYWVDAPAVRSYDAVTMVSVNLVKFAPVEVLTYWSVLAAWMAIDYQRRFREARLREAQLESRLLGARLESLRAQLRPHFLFNSLNAVSSLVRRNDGEGAIRMLAGLGDLLRVSLDGFERSSVPLERELAFARQYLDIERVRFPDRLRVSIEADPAALEVAVPSLILQPLVENAIRHGIEPKTTPSTLEIEARLDPRSGRLTVEVRDDGVGIPDDFDPERDGGIGLTNVAARLAELHPSNHVFTVRKRSGGGTVVRLELPRG